MPSNDQTQALPSGSSPLPAVIPITVTVEVPASLLPLFTSIKKTYNATDAKAVGDCLRFALLTYQQGMVAPADTLLDALVNQMSGFNLLTERIEQAIAASNQASHVSSAAIKSREARLARLQQSAAKKG